MADITRTTVVITDVTTTAIAETSARITREDTSRAIKTVRMTPATDAAVMAVMGTVAATETAAMATEHTKPVMSVDIAKATTVIDEIAETAASSDGRFLIN